MFDFFKDKTNRNFIRLFWAQMISQFGDRISQMALIGLIAERAPGSAWGLAKILSFTIIPVFIVGPIAGALVDRWDRRTTLFLCDIIRGLLVLLIPVCFIAWESLIPIYIIVFFVFCFSRFYVPAKMSIIPDLVKEEHLLMANSLMTTTGMIAFVLGCVLGGFLVDWWGAKGGFIWNAVTFFISGLLIFSIPRHFRQMLSKKTIRETRQEIEDMIRIERSFLAEVREGILYLFRKREIRFVIMMLFILMAAAGALYVLVIVFIQQAFQSVTKDLGILAVFLGLGLLSGTLIYGRWGKRLPWYTTIFVCLMIGGVMMAAFAVVVNYNPNIFIAALLAGCVGVIAGPIFIASNTIVHLVSDENMRGKVFSALEIVIHFAFLAAMMLSALLHKFIPAVWILVGFGALFSGVGFTGAIIYRDGRGLVNDNEKMA